MRYTVIQFARESGGLYPLRGSYVRECDSANRIKNNYCTQLVREGVGPCPFYNSYVK